MKPLKPLKELLESGFKGLHEGIISDNDLIKMINFYGPLSRDIKLIIDLHPRGMEYWLFYLDIEKDLRQLREWERLRKEKN